MKFILIILIPLFTFSQIKIEIPKKWKKYDDAIDFYSTLAVDEIIYEIQTFACPKWKPARKILVSNALTLAYCTVSEKIEYGTWLPYKGKGQDMFTKTWSVPVYDIAKVVWLDVTKPEDPLYDPFTDQKINIPRNKRKRIRKWSLKKQGLLT